MLDSIRKGANNFAIRLLLGVIAFAFVGWGIKDALQQQNNFDIVTFNKAQNISESDFYRAKSEEISFIQKQNQANLTEEDIAQLGINKVVLNQLISKSILKDIASRYELKLNEESILSSLKKAQIFEDSKGNFDYEGLKLAIKNSHLKEQEYFKELEQKILQNVLMTTFVDSFVISNTMIKNINDYLNEERSIELVEMNLKNYDKKYPLPTPNENELIDFYQKHEELFTTKELRDIEYIKFSSKDFFSKMITSKEEIEDFYENNKDEFNSDNFDKVKLQIVDILNRKKLDQFMADINKDLEEQVAAGMSVGEIAKKYDTQPMLMKNVTYEDIADQKSIMNSIADAIFEMSEGETLYPTEIKEGEELVLVEVKSIKLAKLEQFENVKEKAKNLLLEKIVIHNNLKRFEEIAKTYTLERKVPQRVKNLSSIGIKIDQPRLVRSKVNDSLQLPQYLIDLIFKTERGDITQVVRFDDKAYFAYIDQIKIFDSATVDKEKTINNKDEIISSINGSLIESLINYYIRENDMKINFQDSALKEDEES